MLTNLYTRFQTMVHVATERFEDRTDRGASAVEYALVVGLISLAVVVGASVLIGGIDELWADINTALRAAL